MSSPVVATDINPETTSQNDANCVEVKVKNLSDKSYYIIGQLPANVSPEFDLMLQERPTETTTREYQTPRYSQHYMKPYRYAGRLHDAKELPEIFNQGWMLYKRKTHKTELQGLEKVKFKKKI